MAMKTTTIKIDDKVLEEIKVKAIRDKINQQDLITKYLLDGLKRDVVEIDITN